MFISKVKAEGLAHLSYMVGSDGAAAVIDPRRDCQIYLDIAEREEVRITHILETHRNEDYVIGSKELAARTGAGILHGDLNFGYGGTIGDGEEVRIGQVTLRAISTPGHTPESMSYSLVDRSSGPEVVGVFTGDALFVGDVGRTDLLGAERTEALSSALFDSLHEKLLPLGEGVIIYPAHGQGSSCGGAISSREESTIGLEMMQNRALRIGSKDEFVRMKTTEGLEKPRYFTKMEELNLTGPPVLGRAPRPAPLGPAEFMNASRGAQIVDVRPPASYAAAFIPGSLNVPLEVLPNYAGWVLDYGRPYALVVEIAGDALKAARELYRIGHDHVAGYLRGGMEAWATGGQRVDEFLVITPFEARRRMVAGDGSMILDVRTGKEWDGDKIEGAKHIFVGHLSDMLSELPPDGKIITICSSGVRGSLAASILKGQGFKDVSNVLGGMEGWKSAGLPVRRTRGRSGNSS